MKRKNRSYIPYHLKTVLKRFSAKSIWVLSIKCDPLEIAPEPKLKNESTRPYNR